jgi:hypothetical protein
MGKEEQADERAELEEDLKDDLELRDEAAEVVTGGAPNKSKTADKAFTGMADYIKG